MDHIDLTEEEKDEKMSMFMHQREYEPILLVLVMLGLSVYLLR